MSLLPLLRLGVMAGALGWPAIAAADLDLSCSIKNTVRVDLTRLDEGRPWLVRPEYLLAYYPDRARRMNVGGSATMTCEPSEGLGCVSREDAPSDMGFDAASLKISGLLPKSARPFAVRVDFTVLSPSSCFDPLDKAPAEVKFSRSSFRRAR